MKKKKKKKYIISIGHRIAELQYYSLTGFTPLFSLLYTVYPNIPSTRYYKAIPATSAGQEFSILVSTCGIVAILYGVLLVLYIYL